MEVSNNYSYSIREHKFTIWFFRSLIFITLMVLVLFFTIKINESVTISEGEIIAENPQKDLKAPFDGQLQAILTREGQSVDAGDTLVIIKNRELEAQKNQIENELAYLKARAKTISELRSSLRTKLNTYASSTRISSQKLALDTQLLERHMEMTAYQAELMNSRLQSAKEKYEGDSILYHKNMLSKYEFNDARDTYLSLKESIVQLEDESVTYGGEKQLARNAYEKMENELILGKLELEENLNTLHQTEIELENQIKQAEATHTQLTKDLALQYITASEKGTVNFLFNTKLSSNLILKGDLLVSIAPETSNYYAKVSVPEKELPFLEKGLRARLKLDAFNQYDFGTLEGTLDFIAERKENELYYAHIKLPESSDLTLRPGYAVRGEIILNRMSIYQVFIKKIFNKIDGS
ncbi:HlyD family secretion protein [Cyclobacterium roseum]|uniref:HlyD family secretion protein n=1 Tax=Cyclobacterium roseum TaxID=2666137 RepID=UPI0013913802|nr:HlyD family efflux transporter periplasmic adaptor subunit [Cyclobacterium roseum]